MSIKIIATESDVDMVGRPFPSAPRTIVTGTAITRPSHADIVAYLKACRTWWIDAAAAYMELVDKGCMDATYDVRESLTAAQYYAPQN